MSSGLRLRRPVFFAAGLRCPVCLRRIALCPVFLPVFRLSLAGPHFPLPAFPFARVSLCPCLPLSASPFCPCFSQSASPQLCRFVLSRLYSVWFFFCHFLFFRSSSIARRLLSVARCPSLAACCPSLVAPFIVHRPPFVVRRPLSIPCRPLSVARCAVHRSSPAACWRLPVPRTPPRLFPLPFGPDHGFCIRGIPACVSAGAACRVVPQRVPSVGLSAKIRPPPPYLGRRAVSDKITPCILLSGAIFPARPAILLTIWQRLPFGTTFVQIQGVTGAPDPQGGRIPAARKENGKNINN